MAAAYPPDFSDDRRAPARLVLATICLVGLSIGASNGLSDQPPDHAPAKVAGEDVERRVQGRSTVGMPVQLRQLVIPGSELEARPIEDRKTPIVARILATFRHGSDFRYDLEYYGLAPGQYDLLDYLRRKDGGDLAAAEPLWVKIESRLPAGQILPSSAVPASLPRVGGYRALAVIAIALWLVTTAWLVFGRRRKPVELSTLPVAASPAERLRPLVADAMIGRLTPAGQAELERVLLSYWRRRLDLDDTDPVSALTMIREHEVAGALIRQVEAWLHRPEGLAEADITAMLAPYQELSQENEARPLQTSGAVGESHSPAFDAR